jgi:FkbM family methyltransferase
MAYDAEKAAIGRVMRDITSPCVVELGARTGEDEPWIRGVCHEDPCYVMVEPDLPNAQLILDHPRGLDRNRRLILGAVGAHDGEVEFHVSWNPADGSRTSGSIRKPTGHAIYYPSTKFYPHTNTVPCWTLDTIFQKEWLTKIDLLWVDIQGAERDMICGGQQALRRTRYLFLEVESSELYAGQALRDELIAILGSWEIAADLGQNMLFHNPHMIEGRI